MLNIGLIGYGYWGPNLARNFADTPGLRLACVADFSEDRLAAARQRHPAVRTTTDFRELLSDPTIDAVAVATPVSTHFELGMSALLAGKHVWMEKPMAQTSAQARQLAETAERKGLVLIVDHTFIYTPAVRKMRELIEAGELGRIYYYDSMRVNLGLFQRDVSVIADLAVHDFAILDHLLQERAVAVSASGVNHFPGTPANLAYVTLFYPSGAIAHANVSWLAPVKVRQIQVGGSAKMMVYDDLNPDEKLKVYDKGVSFTADAEQILQMRVGYRSGDMWAPRLDVAEALRVEAEHFVDCVTHGRRPLSDAALGLRVVELIEAASASMQRRGETVQLVDEKVAA